MSHQCEMVFILREYELLSTLSGHSLKFLLLQSIYNIKDSFIGLVVADFTNLVYILDMCEGYILRLRESSKIKPHQGTQFPHKTQWNITKIYFVSVVVLCKYWTKNICRVIFWQRTFTSLGFFITSTSGWFSLKRLSHRSRFKNTLKVITFCTMNRKISEHIKMIIHEIGPLLG